MKQIVRITLIALLLTAGYIGAKDALPTSQSSVVYANGTAQAAACCAPVPTCFPGQVCNAKTR
jgi:hypothetical protein